MRRRLPILALGVAACSGGPVAGASDSGADGSSDAGSSCRCVLGNGLRTGLWIESMAVSSAGLLAIAGETPAFTDGETQVLDGATSLHTFPGAAWSVAFSPDGALIAVGTSPVSVYATSDYHKVATVDASQSPVAFSPDGTTLMVGTSDGVKKVKTIDFSVGASLVHASSARERIWQVAFSPDGATLVTASGQVGLGSPHGQISTWRSADLTKVVDLACTSLGISFSTDGKRLAGACWTASRVWNTSDWSLVAELGAKGSAIGVAFSPDGAQIAVGTFLGKLQLVNATDGSVTDTLPGPKGSTSTKALLYRSATTLLGGGWDSADLLTWTLGAH